MFDGVKRLMEEGALILELQGLRQELQGLRVGVERIAAAMELANAHTYPSQVQPDPGMPAVEVTYVNEQVQAELMEVELRLTQALGTPPSEDEIFAAYEQERQMRQETSGG